VPELAELRPRASAHERDPHANGGLLLRDLVLPDFRDYAVDVEARRDSAESTRVSGRSCAT
jgi:xylulose-5-phosphate/fructose-6-phosphate phosphoketolase